MQQQKFASPPKALQQRAKSANKRLLVPETSTQQQRFASPPKAQQHAEKTTHKKFNIINTIISSISIVKKVISSSGSGLSWILKKKKAQDARTVHVWSTKTNEKTFCVFELEKSQAKPTEGAVICKVALRPSAFGCPARVIISTSLHPDAGYKIIEPDWRLQQPLSDEDVDQGPLQEYVLQEGTAHTYLRLDFVGTLRDVATHRLMHVDVRQDVQVQSFVLASPKKSMTPPKQTMMSSLSPLRRSMSPHNTMTISTPSISLFDEKSLSPLNSSSLRLASMQEKERELRRKEIELILKEQEMSKAELQKSFYMAKEKLIRAKTPPRLTSPTRTTPRANLNDSLKIAEEPLSKANTNQTPTNTPAKIATATTPSTPAQNSNVQNSPFFAASEEIWNVIQEIKQQYPGIKLFKEEQHNHIEDKSALLSLLQSALQRQAFLELFASPVKRTIGQKKDASTEIETPAASELQSKAAETPKTPLVVNLKNSKKKEQPARPKTPPSSQKTFQHVHAKVNSFNKTPNAPKTTLQKDHERQLPFVFDITPVAKQPAYVIATISKPTVHDIAVVEIPPSHSSKQSTSSQFVTKDDDSLIQQSVHHVESPIEPADVEPLVADLLPKDLIDPAGDTPVMLLDEQATNFEYQEPPVEPILSVEDVTLHSDTIEYAEPVASDTIESVTVVAAQHAVTASQDNILRPQQDVEPVQQSTILDLSNTSLDDSDGEIEIEIIEAFSPDKPKHEASTAILANESPVKIISEQSVEAQHEQVLFEHVLPPRDILVEQVVENDKAVESLVVQPIVLEPVIASQIDEIAVDQPLQEKEKTFTFEPVPIASTPTENRIVDAHDMQAIVDAHDMQAIIEQPSLQVLESANVEEKKHKPIIVIPPSELIVENVTENLIALTEPSSPIKQEPIPVLPSEIIVDNFAAIAEATVTQQAPILVVPSDIIVTSNAIAVSVVEEEPKVVEIPLVVIETPIVHVPAIVEQEKQQQEVTELLEHHEQLQATHHVWEEKEFMAKLNAIVTSRGIMIEKALHDEEHYHHQDAMHTEHHVASVIPSIEQPSVMDTQVVVPIDVEAVPVQTQVQTEPVAQLIPTLEAVQPLHTEASILTSSIILPDTTSLLQQDSTVSAITTTTIAPITPAIIIHTHTESKPYAEKLMNKVVTQNLGILNTLRKGCNVFKHNYNQKSKQQRILKLDAQCQTLIIEKSGLALFAKKQTKVPLTSIKWIVVGPNTITWKVYDTMFPWRCFSFVCEDRTYDFEAITDEDADNCILAVQYFTYQNAMKFNRSLYTKNSLRMKRMKYKVKKAPQLLKTIQKLKDAAVADEKRRYSV